MENDSPVRVDAVAAIAHRWSEPGATILGLFEDAAPDLSDIRAFEKFVADRLKDDPELLDAWQAYSWDKRTSPSPNPDGLAVGFYDRGRPDATEHRDTPSACADFVFRVAESLLSPNLLKCQFHLYPVCCEIPAMCEPDSQFAPGERTGSHQVAPCGPQEPPPPPQVQQMSSTVATCVEIDL